MFKTWHTFDTFLLSGCAAFSCKSGAALALSFAPVRESKPQGQAGCESVHDLYDPHASAHAVWQCGLHAYMLE